MSKSETKIVSAQFPVATVERLRFLADEADRSLSAELRRAVSEHLALARERPGDGDAQ